jgi:integrase
MEGDMRNSKRTSDARERRLVNFTKAAIEALQRPAKGWRYYRDAKIPGLCVGIGATGARAFVLYRKINGRPERVSIGRYPAITIDQARNEAQRLNGKIAAAENPAEARRALAREYTFGELFAVYLDRHARPRKRTVKEDESKYRQYLSHLAGRRLSRLERRDFAELHARIGKTHQATANRVLALSSSIIGRAIEWGIWSGENLCRGIRRFPEVKRDRFLQGSELPRFFAAVAAEPSDTIRDYVLLSLLTGARRMNVLQMRWADLDLVGALWRIPLTKNGEPQNVPLVPEALQLLRDRRDSVKGEYVLPGSYGAEHLHDVSLGWARILDRDELVQLRGLIAAAGGELEERKGETLGRTLARARVHAARLELDTSQARIADLRAHDLRRTLGSWQAKTGASLIIIGKSLNHKSPTTTAIYARLDQEPVRASMQLAVSEMYARGGRRELAPVAPIREREAA